MDQSTDGLISETKVLCFNSGFVDSSAEEMPLANLLFFLISIAVKSDPIHSIEQRLRDVGFVVGRANKQHIREINGHIDEVVNKTAVLIGI